MSKVEAGTIDATPSKRVFLPIISDYNLLTAICELIDNSYDAWDDPSKGQDLLVNIVIDTEQQSISITDNSGGIPEKYLSTIITPGQTNNSGDDDSIGVFGVGSKRGVVALSQIIKITSRHKSEGTFRIEYDDEWLEDDSWNIKYHRLSKHLNNSTTVIELSKLRFFVSDTDVQNLKTELAEIYSYIISKKFKIKVNDEELLPITFENWSYNPKSPPQEFRTQIKRAKEKPIEVSITGGLISEKGSVLGDYGVFFYCNNRLICKAMKTPEVGYIAGKAGGPHPSISLARVIVKLNGPSKLMPWNSSKSNINYNNDVFRDLSDNIIKVVTNYSKLSSRLKPHAETEIKPFSSGKIKKVVIEKNEKIKPSKLPPIPKIKSSFQDKIIDSNKHLKFSKPYSTGLYESIIAENTISKLRKLEQSNRISLLILDSTLEIALKDYLAYEIPQPLGDKSLQNIFRNRHDVHAKSSETLLPGDDVWDVVKYFYTIRCDLMHKKASAQISDDHIETFRSTVYKILEHAFGLVLNFSD